MSHTPELVMADSMRDQCVLCKSRGCLDKCLDVPCYVRDSWYVETISKDNATLRAAIQTHAEEAA
jgi:hypothetical protein